MVNPDNFQAMEAVDFLAKKEGFLTEYFLISNNSFRAAFKLYKNLNEELVTALKTKTDEVNESLLSAEKKEELDLVEVTKSAPIAKIVSVIIRHAVEGKASDIHIEPLLKESRVRYRIDGILHTSLILPKSVHSAVVARIKVMANLKLDETRIPQDGRIRLMIEEKEYDFRISTMPLVGEEKVVMRILDTSRGAPTFQDLGYQGLGLKIIENAIKKTEGILLVTGPTGSGKSTTLFSILSLLNKEGINISTLEDPVEYKLKGANQSQVKPEIGYTFASGLRSFLRQDPDIIMVGEIRDDETAELSIHAALTGHFVLSTVHTISASGAIARLVDMGIESFLLGSTLKAIISQRLTRKICDNCKEEFSVPPEFIEAFKKQIAEIDQDYLKEVMPNFDINNLKIYKGKGCARCGNEGYRGRVAIAEILDINKDMQKMIIGGKKHFTTEEIKANQKFITLQQDGLIKVLQGLTTIDEVLRVSRE
jgi:type IV pilus assembly protein PilB